MKKFLLPVLLCCILSVRAQRAVDVQHYQFEMILSDSSNVINGAATICLKLNQNVGTIVLDLMSTMQVTNVQLDGSIATWKHENNKLQIQNKAEGNDKTIVINYHGTPKDGLIISTNKFHERTFFADNWPDRARHWLPCVDDPADKASVEFIVTAPMHYQVVSNGVQVEETVLNDTQKLTHWKETTALPTKIMVIGVAKFAVQYVGDTLGVPLYSWVYPQEKDKAFYDYSQAKDILPFLINYVAPFPYRKLANVQSKTIFGGMENAGCIFYTETAITGQRKAEDLLTHEIAHQWFGDMATEKSFAHLWLSEGFATYMTDMYIEYRHGIDSMNSRLRNERADVISFNKGKPKAVVDSATKDYMQLLNANSYQKGAWCLHMLRNLLGPEVFMQGVRAYYKRYAGSNASTDDFRKVMEEVSGKDLKSFFKQWLYSPGVPALKVSHSYNAQKNILLININQQQANAFAFPLEIEINTATGRLKKVVVQVTKASEQFSIPVTGDVTRVVLDPGVKLLFEQIF